MGNEGDTIDIIIADDHAIIRSGLATLLETESDLRVVGQASDGAEAVALAAELKPDVAILDLQMPRMDGVSATAGVLRASPETKVVVLTTFNTSDTLSDAIAAGASGAFLKTVAETDLIDAIRRVAAGEKVVHPDVEKLIMSDPPAPKLTERQLLILEAMTHGLTNQDMARQFGISVSAVNQHILGILAKLGAANRTEAAAIAIRKHLLKL